MHNRRTFSRLALLPMAMALMALAVAAPASAGVEDWQKGASIRSSSPENFASEAFRQSLRELADANANFVTLILPWKQEDLRSSEIYLHSGAAPTDEALVAAIEYAHQLGLQVNLKPHLDEENYAWRARIEARDASAWFRSYGDMLLHYAELAEEHGVELITIGSELVSMTGSRHTHRWRDLIADVRAVYSGELTYSANWGGGDWAYEKDNIGFWDDLDYIGIAAYFPLNSPHNLDSLVSQWERWDRREVRPLHERWGKPVLFTEIGYRSIPGALSSPWDWSSSGRKDEDTQALAYKALFEYWDTRDYFQGLHLWVWRNPANDAFWESDTWATGYTPQRKEAEAVMAEWFAIGAQTASANTSSPQAAAQSPDTAQTPDAAQQPSADVQPTVATETTVFLPRTWRSPTWPSGGWLTAFRFWTAGR